jgi:hypothetical protein
MRPLPFVILAFTGAALCAGAVAQDRDGTRSPTPQAPAATTGSAPRGLAAQAPVGHRQPTATGVPSTAVPSQETTGAAQVSPYDQEIDRNLTICRGC